MTNRCYAMVRGSAVRITGLGKRGELPDPIQYAVSKSVATVQINEVTEASSNEFIGLDSEDDENRLHFIRPEQPLFYTVDVDFLRTDPGVLSLVAGVQLIYDYPGFGMFAFGEGPFGGTVPDGATVIGFDSETRQPAASFALEVWSRLAGENCAPGVREYGYTLFPFLKGGYLSGFKFENGLVSFNLRKAMTRKVPRWGVGPYDLEGPQERLTEMVSRNSMFRTLVTTAPPPAEQDGIQTTTDVIDGGTATVTSADVVDGQTVSTSVWIVEGGRAL